MKNLKLFLLALVILFWFNSAFGQCGVPAGTTTLSATTTSSTIKWNAVSGALSYNVQYRVVNTTTWSIQYIFYIDYTIWSCSYYRL